MKKAEYPATIPAKEQYTAGDIAVLFGVSHRTACNMIDNKHIAGFKVPGSEARRVLHTALQDHVRLNPQYAFVLRKLT